jgi:hypothetical protein
MHNSPTLQRSNAPTLHPLHPLRTLHPLHTLHTLHTLLPVAAAVKIDIIILAASALPIHDQRSI